MGPVVWNVDPEIIKLFGSIPIRYYGLCILLGVLISYQIVKKVYVQEHIPIEKLEQLSTYLFVGIVIGMRLGHCLFYDFEYYSNHIVEIFVPFRWTNDSWEFTGFQGLASHGGSIGAILAIVFYSFKHKTSIFWILDRIAIVAPITGAFIHLGNFMNSEIYGKPTHGNYGVIFMRDDMIPRHPTQLYEAFAYVLIFFAAWFSYKTTNVRHYKGMLFGFVLIAVFTARFIIEYFKENQVAFEDAMTINMGQWLSIPFIVSGIVLLFLSRLQRETML
ncbi:prolipoprotein diacylglyceryl transferase [Aquimarina sp. U1-2]|uniref:prolipoprotein diacylglyceryl transferase n=1 Tax=Aquimarina sp. U1-2 TaxID=2823141 RepID=UPI001AECABE0|nr:prolipoprotein diacylglyceryl transferase [Aquimarina sp. U1-2]MBP2831404.1 prolipoprotein diacylglyceryl transferase [Aquimarina sp. U1-2]